jgi:tetratricopeptide (TPR) repeat protein
MAGWWLLTLRMLAAPQSLAQGQAALAEYRVEEAAALLERAKGEGPYRLADHVQLYESLGVAYAYLGRRVEALEAFDMLLALDPGHAIGYTLSPKATFLFEEARKLAARRPPPAIELYWPRDLQVGDPIPIDLEVIADPKGLLRRAVLQVRRKGEASYGPRAVELVGPGRYQRLVLDPVAPIATASEAVQLYLVVTDERGNEVFQVADAAHPREIALAYQAAEPWYRRWWVWATIGAVLAAGTATSTYFLLREPPDRVGGSFQVP